MTIDELYRDLELLKNRKKNFGFSVSIFKEDDSIHDYKNCLEAMLEIMAEYNKILMELVEKKKKKLNMQSTKQMCDFLEFSDRMLPCFAQTIKDDERSYDCGTEMAYFVLPDRNLLIKAKYYKNEKVADKDVEKTYLLIHEKEQNEWIPKFLKACDADIKEIEEEIAVIITNT